MAASASFRVACRTVSGLAAASVASHASHSTLSHIQCEGTPNANNSHIATKTNNNNYNVYPPRAKQAAAVGNLRKRMTSIGHFSLISERNNPSIITFFMKLDSPLSVGQFHNMWEQQNMSQQHQRFLYTISDTHPGHFEHGKHEDIQQHVKETVPPQGREELIHRLQIVQMQPWNLSDKLWQVWLAKDTLLFQSHHVLADGASIGAALVDLADEAPEFRKAIQHMVKKHQRKSRSAWKRIIRNIKRILWFLQGSIQVLCRQASIYWESWSQPNPWKILRSQSKEYKTRSLSFTHVASVEQVKWVARQLLGPKGTVNDVFCACVAAATDRLLQYHQRRAYELGNEPLAIPENMIVALPVHLYGGIILGEIGNKLGALSVRVPRHQESAIERLETIHKELVVAKQSPMALLTHLIARGVSLSSRILPVSAAGWLYEHSHGGASVVVTNTRGSPKPLHFHGRKVESFVGFIPLPPGVPVGVVVSSYDGKIMMTATAEKWAVTDDMGGADGFLSWVLEEYLHLAQSAKDRAKQPES